MLTAFETCLPLLARTWASGQESPEMPSSGTGWTPRPITTPETKPKANCCPESLIKLVINLFNPAWCMLWVEMSPPKGMFKSNLSTVHVALLRNKVFADEIS